MNAKVEQIAHSGKVLAIIVPSGFRREGIEFFTPGELAQQLGYMNRPAGHCIPPHSNPCVKREILGSPEVLFVRSGRVSVDLYTDEGEFVGNRVLGAGDVILLVSGGHGLKMLDATEMIEVKQGPYAGDEGRKEWTVNRKGPAGE